MIRRLVFRFLPAQWRHHIRQYRRLRLQSGYQLGSVMLLGVVALAFEAVGVSMILPIVEYIQSSGAVDQVGGGSKIWSVVKGVFGIFGQPVTLGGLCIVVFVLIVMRQVASNAFMTSQNELKHDIGRKLAMRAFSTVLNSNALHIRSVGGGTFVNLVDHQSQAAAVVVRCYVTIVQLMLTAITYLAVMVSTAPLTSMAAISVVLIAVGGMGRLASEGRTLSKDVIEKRTAIVTFLNERYVGWRLIKTFGTLRRESEVAENLSRDFAHMSVELVRQVGRIQMVIGSVLAGMTLLVVYVSVRYLDTTSSTLALFLIILVRLVPVAQAMASQRHSIALCEASLDFMADHLEKARLAKDEDRGAVEFSGLKHAIVLKDLHFQYPGTSRAALDSVSATFKAGDLTAVIGPSGAGKSTLADLLPRFIEPDSGVIEIDGRPAADYALSSLRRQIAYVGQETVLFSGTVRENVSYGRPEATEIEIEEACRRAFAHEFILDLPAGYETWLGPDGVDLSGGQKQRLGLARALLVRSSIIVLDEPTSALDVESENKIRDAIEALRSEHRVTLIVIAHRLSFVREAQWIVVMDGGKVLEAGRRDDLIASGGWLRRALDDNETASHARRSVVPL